ncbi:MAG: CDP-glycerol glycerophosphotransferase family protein [Bacillaceae bacterium]
MIVKISYSICRLFPIQRKVCFVVSYGENALEIYHEMKKRGLPYKVVFLYKSTCKYDLTELTDVQLVPFESSSPFHTIQSSYHLATSSIIIVDNYFGTFADIKLRQNVKCVQVWHAGGAFKKFGLLAESTFLRGNRALRRFKRVYNSFTHVVVGSDEMALVFQGAFGIPKGRFVPIGIPRTDLFFDQKRQTIIRDQLKKENPNIKGKKVILYAPTFRNEQLVDFSFCLDIDLLYEALKEEYVLFVKIHPAIKHGINFEEKYPNFAFDYSSYKNINELLVITDILISDYSSVPFEYALFSKPMIFYAYDRETYEEDPGFIKPYDELAPGPIVSTTSSIITLIKEQRFDSKAINVFSLRWNQYSVGSSSKKFIDYFFHEGNEGE